MKMNMKDFRSMIIRREEPGWLQETAGKARKLHRERKQFQKMRGGRTTMCKEVDRIVRSGFNHMAVGHIFHCARCKEAYTGPFSLCDLFDQVHKRRVAHLPQIVKIQDVQAADKHVEQCARCWRIQQESLEEKHHDCSRFEQLLEYAIKDPGWLRTKYPDVMWFQRHKNVVCGQCHRLFLEHFPNGY